MKRILLIILLFFTTATAFSQRFYGSLIAGANATQVDGDQVYGFHKFGFNGGASVMLALNKKQTWFATVELLFTQKGAYRKSLVDSMFYENTNYINFDVPYNKKIKYKLNLNYVEVPVIFHYEDPRTGFAFGAGVAWGRLVYAKEVENGYTLLTNVRSGTYSKNEWSVLGDLKVRLWKNLKLNFRYQYTFIPIRERTFTNTSDATWTRKQYHNVLTLRLIYTFNEKYKLNTKTNKYGERMGVKWIRDVSTYDE